MKSIDIEDLLRFRFIENLSFDPSGKRYAYQLVSIDEKKDSYFRTVYVNKKAFKADKSTRILGWYDEEHLLVSEEKKNKNDVFNKVLIMDVKDGKRKTFLTTPLGIGNVKVIDQETLVFTAGIDANDPDLYMADKETLKKKKEELKKEADYEVLDEIPYWLNGQGFINKKRNALFICHLHPLKIERLTEPLFNTGSITVHDSTVYFSGNAHSLRGKLYDKLYAYSLKDNRLTCLYDREDYMIGALHYLNDRLLILASDGRHYGINETSRFHELEDGRFKQLPSFDRSLYDSVATDIVLGGGKGQAVHDGALYTLASEKDHVEIWKIDGNLKKTVLVSKPLINFFDVSDKGIIFSAADETSLPELYHYDLKDQKITRLTSFNEKVLKDRYVAIPQELEYDSLEEKLNGWVLLPKDHDPKKTYPAVLDVHGGPRAIYSPSFFHEMQVWASRGYFVLFTNIRGSDGRGDAFADIRGHYGDEDFRNLMDFTDAVLKKYPEIDKDRLCETGGSYGGFMTNWIIGHTDRFCCAASQRSIANWTGFAYLSDIGYYFATDQNKVKDLYKGFKKLWDHSPLKYADQVKTPTLFIHSDQDYRCPLPEGMQMMQALADRNIETRLVLFHGENHELSRSGKPSHRIRRLKEITAWFDRHTQK